MGSRVLQSTAVETDFGWTGIARSVAGIRLMTLPKQSREECLEEIWYEVGETDLVSEHDGFGSLPERLRRYFKGEVVDFPDVLDFADATRFRRTAWQIARTISYGETQTYRWVAEKVGKPLGARAIGQAMGANPVPIIVPCHRVIGSDGGLRGFGGGLDLKERMLRLEGAWKSPRIDS